MKINLKLSDKAKHKIAFYIVVLFFGYISVAYSADLGDANATQDEMTKFNEKYLKGKLQADNNNSVARMIKLSDIATQKDINVSFQNQMQKNISFTHSDSEEAKKLNQFFTSQDFREKVKDHKKLILENINIGGQKMDVSDEMKKQLNEENDQSITGSEHIFIVISSSMPDTDLKTYFSAVEGKQNITFVLRGLIGDIKKFEPTRLYLERLIKKFPEDKSSQEVYNVAVEINPKITRKYHIDKVPAIIYVKNYNGQAEDNEPLDQNDSEQFWVSYGMASFDYIIEQINKEAKSEWLLSLLDKKSFFRDRTN